MRAVCATYVFSASNADMCMCALCALYARLMRAVMFGFVFLYEAALLHEVCSMRVVCATYARCGFLGSFSLESLRSLCAPYACLMRAVALQCAPYACCMRHLSALLSLTVAQCARFKVRLSACLSTRLAEGGPLVSGRHSITTTTTTTTTTATTTTTTTFFFDDRQAEGASGNPEERPRRTLVSMSEVLRYSGGAAHTQLP